LKKIANLNEKKRERKGEKINPKKCKKSKNETKAKTVFLPAGADFSNSLKISKLENNTLIFNFLSPPPPEPGIT